MKIKQLRRSNDKMIGGVMGGIADYFEVDPTIVRLAYGFCSMVSCVIPGIIFYIFMWVVMPAAEE